jgi:hypothetical protein
VNFEQMPPRAGRKATKRYADAPQAPCVQTDFFVNKWFTVNEIHPLVAQATLKGRFADGGVFGELSAVQPRLINARLAKQTWAVY